MQRKAPYRTSRRPDGASKSRTAAKDTTGAGGAKSSASTALVVSSTNLLSQHAAVNSGIVALLGEKEVALEIVQQSVRNALNAGLMLLVKNVGGVQKNGKDVLAILLPEAFYCGVCGNFSLGDKCSRDHATMRA